MAEEKAKRNYNLNELLDDEEAIVESIKSLFRERLNEEIVRRARMAFSRKREKVEEEKPEKPSKTPEELAEEDEEIRSILLDVTEAQKLAQKRIEELKKEERQKRTASSEVDATSLSEELVRLVLRIGNDTFFFEFVPEEKATLEFQIPMPKAKYREIIEKLNEHYGPELEEIAQKEMESLASGDEEAWEKYRSKHAEIVEKFKKEADVRIPLRIKHYNERGEIEVTEVMIEPEDISLGLKNALIKVEIENGVLRVVGANTQKMYFSQKIFQEIKAEQKTKKEESEEKNKAQEAQNEEVVPHNSKDSEEEERGQEGLEEKRVDQNNSSAPESSTVDGVSDSEEVQHEGEADLLEETGNTLDEIARDINRTVSDALSSGLAYFANVLKSENESAIFKAITALVSEIAKVQNKIATQLLKQDEEFQAVWKSLPEEEKIWRTAAFSEEIYDGTFKEVESFIHEQVGKQLDKPEDMLKVDEKAIERLSQKLSATVKKTVENFKKEVFEFVESEMSREEEETEEQTLEL